MKRGLGSCVALALLLSAVRAPAQVPMPPDESQTRGKVVPDITLTDDHGVQFRLGELAGLPLLLSPIFTACPGACIAITSTLRDAVQSAGTIGRDFNVLTISFDPADTVEKMHAYREQQGLPDAWRMAVASADDRMKLLDAVDFNFMSLEGGMFSHANEVVVLDKNLAVSGYLHGTLHTPETVVSALQVATGKKSLWRHQGNTVFLIAVGGIIVTALATILLITRRRAKLARG